MTLTSYQLLHPAINWRFFSEERLTSKPLAQVGLLFVFRYVSHVLTQLLVVPRSFGTLRILFEPYAARVKSSIKPSPYTLNHYCSIATERVGAPHRNLNTDFLCGRADSEELLHVPGKLVTQQGVEPPFYWLRTSCPAVRRLRHIAPRRERRKGMNGNYQVAQRGFEPTICSLRGNRPNL